MNNGTDENVIILRSVFKITDCWMEPSIDPATKRFPHTVRRVNSDGDAILTKEDIENKVFFIKETDAIRLYDGIRFDLNDEYDYAWWEAIKFSPKIAKERFERDSKGNLYIDGDGKRYGRAEFYIERPGKESKSRVNHKKLVHDAQSYIWSDDHENIYTKVKLLGTRMDLAPVSDVQDFLLKRAEKDPQEIISLYTDKNIGLRILLLDAKDRYVIVHKDGAFMYGDIILGYTTDSVINFFKNVKNVRILNAIKAEVYPDFESSSTGISAPLYDPLIPNENNPVDQDIEEDRDIDGTSINVNHPVHKNNLPISESTGPVVTLGKKTNTKK